MAKRGKNRRKFEGLWIPNHIRNIPRRVLDHLGKNVLAHIYSFGKKGCWQNNDTIAKIFMVSTRTISRKITAIKKAGEIYVKSPKGYYRTMWAKCHPDVQTAVRLHYRGKQIPKTGNSAVGQNYPSGIGKGVQVSRTDECFRLRQGCPTTNKETNKETIRKTKAVGLPLPAGGQSSQLLDDRKAQTLSDVERLKKQFGRPRRAAKLSPDEFDKERRRQIQALRAVEKLGIEGKGLKWLIRI